MDDLKIYLPSWTVDGGRWTVDGGSLSLKSSLPQKLIADSPSTGSGQH